MVGARGLITGLPPASALGIGALLDRPNCLGAVQADAIVSTHPAHSETVIVSRPHALRIARKVPFIVPRAR
jgi:hypothetical protein